MNIPTREELIDFCKYLQPIMNACSGFIKTNGYMLHIPGRVMMMSADETVFAYINIPVIYNIMIIADIGAFLRAKEEDEQAEILRSTYFLGSNIKYDTLLRYNELYGNRMILPLNVYFTEDDCLSNINGFAELVKSSDIGFMNVTDGHNYYMIPVSKAITPITKSDMCKIEITDYISNPSDITKRTVHYTTFKKKFKIEIELFMNILVFA